MECITANWNLFHFLHSKCQDVWVTLTAIIEIQLTALKKLPALIGEYVAIHVKPFLVVELMLRKDSTLWLWLVTNGTYHFVKSYSYHIRLLLMVTYLLLLPLFFSLLFFWNIIILKVLSFPSLKVLLNFCLQNRKMQARSRRCIFYSDSSDQSHNFVWEICPATFKFNVSAALLDFKIWIFF